MPEDVTVIELVNRMAGIEARLKSGEDKSDRIESMLNELVRNQHVISQSSDDRIEKILADKLEPIKDQLRDSKTKIESLEGNRRYNIVGVAVVCGALFTVFTWFSNQSAESTRQLVAAENTAQRSDLTNRVNEARNQIENKVNQNSNDITQIQATLQGYGEFKGLVTQQNATSIQDRTDQGHRIERLEQSAGEHARLISGLTATVDQKFTEVETQFNADGQLRNVQFSEQQRKNGDLQNTLHELGGKIPNYPNAPYYQPNVSQQRSSGNGP